MTRERLPPNFNRPIHLKDTVIRAYPIATTQLNRTREPDVTRIEDKMDNGTRIPLFPFT